MSSSSKVQFPLDPSAYRVEEEIGSGGGAVVFKATCLPMGSKVAMKRIQEDQSYDYFHNIHRETNTPAILSHINIVGAHCSFASNGILWVVMPFMAAGCIQSITSSAFQEGLPEPCVAAVLKQTLKAVSFLHEMGNIHRNIGARNIFIDSDFCVKLAYLGDSASVYEANSSGLAGTPYWMAPEAIHSYKADIWSFGITALELAHGGPPLSPAKRFPFGYYENPESHHFKIKNLSEGFTHMVSSCLAEDPNKRPSAQTLLAQSFFKNCNEEVFLVKSMLSSVPAYRFNESKHASLSGVNESKSASLSGVNESKNGEEGDSLRLRDENRRISGWNFNKNELVLDPAFGIESGEPSSPSRLASAMAQVAWLILDPAFPIESGEPSSPPIESGEPSSPPIESGEPSSPGLVHRGAVFRRLDQQTDPGLIGLVRGELNEMSLDQQTQPRQVELSRGKLSNVEQRMMKLKVDLEEERKTSLKLRRELENEREMNRKMKREIVRTRNMTNFAVHILTCNRNLES